MNNPYVTDQIVIGKENPVGPGRWTGPFAGGDIRVAKSRPATADLRPASGTYLRRYNARGRRGSEELLGWAGDVRASALVDFRFMVALNSWGYRRSHSHEFRATTNDYRLRIGVDPVNEELERMYSNFQLNAFDAGYGLELQFDRERFGFDVFEICRDRLA